MEPLRGTCRFSRNEPLTRSKKRIAVGSGPLPHMRDGIILALRSLVGILPAQRCRPPVEGSQCADDRKMSV